MRDLPISDRDVADAMVYYERRLTFMGLPLNCHLDLSAHICLLDSTVRYVSTSYVRSFALLSCSTGPKKQAVITHIATEPTLSTEYPLTAHSEVRCLT